jgi:multiple sugar transport system ATP-binding protein
MFRYNEELKARKPGVAELSAPVDVVEPTGAETMALLKLGERDVVGRFDPDEQPKPGEQMRLAIDMANVCLFDPTTETLIPRAVA